MPPLRNPPLVKTTQAGEVRHAQVPFVLQPGALEKMRARHNSGNGMMQAGSV